MKFHDELNPIIWDKDNDNQMRPEVLAKLKEIANAFIEYIEIPEDAVLDIVVTGSSASYNYNKYSDLDLHIIVDYNKIHEDCPLVEGYLGALKNTFNKEHDIFIKDVPVELYAEKQGQGTVHNGLYSVQEEEWIDRPEKIAPTDNDAAVEAKFNEIKDMVDKCDDSEVATELLEKIYNMRKAGLAESGEFCTENLAFKKLRNEGCMDKLRKLKKEKIDKQLSLESYNETLEQDVKELTKTDDYYKVDGSRVSIKNGFGSQIELMDLQNLGKKLEKKGYKVYCSNYYIDAKKNESIKESENYNEDFQKLNIEDFKIEKTESGLYKVAYDSRIGYIKPDKSYIKVRNALGNAIYKYNTKDIQENRKALINKLHKLFKAAGIPKMQDMTSSIRGYRPIKYHGYYIDKYAGDRTSFHISLSKDNEEYANKIKEILDKEGIQYSGSVNYFEIDMEKQNNKNESIKEDTYMDKYKPMYDKATELAQDRAKIDFVSIMNTQDLVNYAVKVIKQNDADISDVENMLYKATYTPGEVEDILDMIRTNLDERYYRERDKNEPIKEDYPKNREELINKYNGVFKKNGITLEISNLYNKKEDNFSSGFGKSYNVEGKVFNKFEKALEYMKKLSNKKESLKEGFNKGDKVQLKRKNNKIGIVKSIFNGDKDKNDKNIKYLDVEFEDGTKEGRPASDFKKINESIKENKMNEGFKKLTKTEQEIEKILQQNGFKTSEVHKDKGELIKLWYVEKDVKLDGLQHEIGTKVEGKDFKEILKKVKAAFVKNESLQESSIIDRFKELVNKIAKDFKEQGYPKSKKFLLDFVDEAVKEFNTFNDYKIKVSTDNGTAVLTLADMYQGRINAERKTVKFTDLENSNYAYESLNNNLQQLICEAIECKEPYETQEEINGFKLCSFFGYHYANAVYVEEKETGKTVGWDQYENELYLEGPNMETKTYELVKQPELTANVEEVKNMLPSILADGNIQDFPVYQFLEKISQINKDILENYPIYWDKNHEGNREPIKNEDVATLTDKVDQANNDLQDIIKSLNNEALQEPVEIGTRVGTPDGEITGTVKEVNVADKTVKIDTDEIPGKGKEEKVFKIEELDNIIKEALEE